MEHRRRRPQAIQPGLTEQESMQATAAETHSATHQEALEPQMREAFENAAPVRRRRRAQTEETPELTDPAAAADAGTADFIRTANRETLEKDKRIPMLPHEDVHVEEAEPEADAALVQTGRLGKNTKPVREKTGRQRSGREKETGAAAAKAGRNVLAGGKTLLGYVGGAFLLLLMAAAQGISVLKKQIAGRNEEKAFSVHEEGHAPDKVQAVELEAIRPEDYRGRAQNRQERRSRKPTEDVRTAGKKRKGRKPDLQQILSLFFAGVALVSFCMIVSILWRTVRTKRTNEKLAEIYAQASENSVNPEQTPEFTVFMPEEQDDAEIELYVEEPEDEAAWGEEILWDDETENAQETGLTNLPDENLPADPGPTPIPMGKRVFHQVGGDALPQMEALHKENRDIVGWLKIENVLDLPVVYKDNSYYLTRDFYKQKNTAGTIFLDENHPFKEKTQNLLLHGHNMKDGTMFGRLIQYETDLNYVRWHPFVQFDTLWRKEEYVIFAVLRVSLDVKNEAFFNYFTHPTFSSDNEFNSYIRHLQLRSLYAIPIDVKPTDALITLSTCLEDDRLVIVGRRVRSGETHTDLRALTNLTTRQ